MTSKAVRGLRLGKDGKVSRKSRRMAAGQRKNAEAKAKRQEKAWRAKSK